MDVLDGGPGNNTLVPSAMAPSALSLPMESSFATTAPSHGVTSLAGPQTSHSALLAHPHT
jgi:hypothetical protein